MSEQAKDAPEGIKYETMPGADAVEAQEGDDLDMNFAFGEEAEETEAEAEVEETEEDVSHETEEAKETEEVEAKETEPEKKETKSPMIPKSRLDEVLAQNLSLIHI